MKRAPGEVVATTKRGVTIRYSPSMGSTVRYRITCPHGAGVNARTLADAREAAGDPGDFCNECGPEHRIRHYVYAGDERIPRTATMRGAWPCDAECSCGWSTGTGGAVRSYIDKLVDEHKTDVELGLTDD